MAAATFPRTAAAVGIMSTAAAKNNSSPRVRLDDPGGEVITTLPMTSHVPASTPIPVPPTESRARKPKTDARSCKGTANTNMTSATWWASDMGSHCSCRPLRTIEAAPRAAKPRGSGLPIGRNTSRASLSTRGETCPSSVVDVCESSSCSRTGRGGSEDTMAQRSPWCAVNLRRVVIFRAGPEASKGIDGRVPGKDISHKGTGMSLLRCRS